MRTLKGNGGFKMKMIVVAALAAASLPAASANVRAAPIDMTTLEPIYLASTGEYVFGVSPH
jgi:hypothetical protein